MRESVSQLNQATDCLLEETETKCFHKNTYTCETLKKTHQFLYV